jgi:hypothetical protein
LKRASGDERNVWKIETELNNDLRETQAAITTRSSQQQSFELMIAIETAGEL